MECRGVQAGEAVLAVGACCGCLLWVLAVGACCGCLLWVTGRGGTRRDEAVHGMAALTMTALTMTTLRLC